MAPLSIDMLDGSHASIDPTRDPNGYQIALAQRFRNRNAMAMMQPGYGTPGHYGSNPGLEQMVGPVGEIPSVNEANGAKPMKLKEGGKDDGGTSSPFGVGDSSPMSTTAAQSLSQGPFGTFGIGTGGVQPDGGDVRLRQAIKGLKTDKVVV